VREPGAVELTVVYPPAIGADPRLDLAELNTDAGRRRALRHDLDSNH
jgi:hypothetical protein